MRVLVTGATGFVGKNLLAHPGLARHEVLTMRWPGGRVDLNSWRDTSISIAGNSPDIVVHLAGRVGGIQDNIAHPIAFLMDNLTMGLNVLNACREAGVKRVINLGSSCMYPTTAPQPFKEESLFMGPVEPTNEAYALAKLTVMRLGQYLSAEGITQVKTLIPPGLYGPHAHFEGDKAHLVCAVMARLHKAKQEGAKSVPIWGDGTARREFLFAPDLADCIVRAIDEFDSLPEVMNVGTGWDRSVDQWTRKIASIIGYEGEFVHDTSKPSGQPRKVMDLTRAKEWWGGKEWPASLDDALYLTYDWYVKNAV